MADNTNQNNPATQREFNDAINEYRSLLKSISAELGAQKSYISAANDEYRKMDSIARQLQSTEEGINGLTSEQIAKLKQKYSLSVGEIGNQAKQLLSQKGIVNLTETQLKYLKERGKVSEKEAALLKGYLEDYELEKSMTETINSKLEERIKYEEEVNSLTGATGAIIDGMEGSMKALGLSSMSNYLNIDAAKKAMQEEADAVARGEKEGGKLSVRMAGIKAIAEGLNKSLFSTEAIIGFIVTQLAEGSQNMANFQKQTGMSYQSAYAMNMEMKGIAAATGDSFITSEKLNKSYATLTEHLGVSADILGGTALVSATNLEQRLGMSADNAAQLTTYTRLQGKDTEKILSNSIATVGAFNRQNKTAINSRQVLNDVAGASKSMYLNMGKSTEALVGAATKARSLGLSLEQVNKVQESMLNFEESIGNELEANLLLGGGVNLAKAREYSLTGDIKGLTDEIGKQESIRNAFATKNVIAQDAAAKALGLSREELAGMALQQDLNNLSAEEFKNRYGEVTYESMKSRSATEKFGDALDKVKDLLGGVIQAFSPIIDLVAWLLDNPIAPWIVSAFIASKALGSSFNGIKSTVTSIVGGIKDIAKGGLGKVTDSLTSKASSAAVPEQAGKGTGSLTDSIQKIKPAQLIAGAAAMALVAASVYIFAKAAQEFATVSWEDMAKAGVGLLGLVAALAAVGAIMMSGVGAVAILAGAAAITVMAGGLFILGKALQEIGEGMNLMTPALTVLDSLGSKAAALGTVQASLMGIADGLREISDAGIGAIPVLDKLVALGSGGNSIGESKTKVEEGSLAAVEAKLTELISVVKSGGHVYLDSNKVGRAQILGSHKSA
jgi:hypothetical protein